jgi:hypothetical protein
MCFPPRLTGFRCELAEHRNLQSYACSDCSAVSLEGDLPPSNHPDISEFLRKSEMSGYPAESAVPSGLLPLIGASSIS